MGKFFDKNVEASYLDDYLFIRCMDINYAGMITNSHCTYDTIIWRDGVTIPSESEWDSKLAELTAEYESTKYQRDREYPVIGDQLDMIYKDNKNGTTTHADAVEAVKTKWPKDNSGPVE